MNKKASTRSIKKPINGNGPKNIKVKKQIKVTTGQKVKHKKKSATNRPSTPIVKDYTSKIIGCRCVPKALSSQISTDSNTFAQMENDACKEMMFYKPMNTHTLQSLPFSTKCDINSVYEGLTFEQTVEASQHQKLPPLNDPGDKVNPVLTTMVKLTKILDNIDEVLKKNDESDMVQNILKIRNDSPRPHKRSNRCPLQKHDVIREA